MSRDVLPIASRPELIGIPGEQAPLYSGSNTPAEKTVVIYLQMFLDAETPAISMAPPSWIDEEIEILGGLRNLEENWNTYGASAPNETAIENAARALEHLSNLDVRPDRIAASTEGGVAISFFENRKYADMEFFNSGEIAAIVSDSIDREVWEVPESEVGASLERIVEFADRRHDPANAKQSSSTSSYVFRDRGTLLSIQESASSTRWQTSTGLDSLSRYLSE